MSRKTETEGRSNPWMQHTERCQSIAPLALCECDVSNNAENLVPYSSLKVTADRRPHRS